MTTINKTCSCGATFQTEAFPDWKFFEATECDVCYAEREAKRNAEMRAEAEKRQSERRVRFQSQADALTPVRILQTDLKSSHFNRALWERVAKWNPTSEKPWLGLVSPPGECKTRCAFLRMRMFAGEQADGGCSQFNCAVITGMDFNRLAVERFQGRNSRNSMSVADAAGATLRQSRTTRLLIFDELGKVKPTAGTIEELFALLDYRHAQNLTTIWTSNRTPEQFCTEWPEEYAGPSAGRIIEASIILQA